AASLGHLRTNPVDELRFTLLDHPGHHSHQLGLGAIAPGGISPAALAPDHSPALQVSNQHRDPSFGEPELALDLAGGELLAAQIEQRPDAPLVALDPPELDHVPHGIDRGRFPARQLSDAGLCLSDGRIHQGTTLSGTSSRLCTPVDNRLAQVTNWAPLLDAA